MSIINLPLTRYYITPQSEGSKFILHSICGRDLIIDMPSEECISIILKQISLALDEFKSNLDPFKIKEYPHKIHRDDDGLNSVEYHHSFVLSFENYKQTHNFSLREDLISNDAFKIPERKNCIIEVPEVLD